MSKRKGTGKTRIEEYALDLTDRDISGIFVRKVSGKWCRQSQTRGIEGCGEMDELLLKQARESSNLRRS